MNEHMDISLLRLAEVAAGQHRTEGEGAQLEVTRQLYFGEPAFALEAVDEQAKAST